MSTKRNTRTETLRAETSTVPVSKKKRKTVPQVLPQELPQEPKRKTVSQVLPQELPQEPVSQVSQVFQKTLEKIINQNSKIVQKLDQLISGQKSLENRMTKLEQVPDIQHNEELIKVIKTLVIYILFKIYILIN